MFLSGSLYNLHEPTHFLFGTVLGDMIDRLRCGWEKRGDKSEEYK